MASKPIVRVWQEMEIKSIEPYLLIAGSTTADCASCKEVSISLDAKTCPKCGTSFKYMGTRLSSSPKEARRLKTKRPDLTIIEFKDFKGALSRDKAHGFLNGLT